MGYQLPIRHVQYTQYVNRTIDDVEDPFDIPPTTPVNMDTKFQLDKRNKEKEQSLHDESELHAVTQQTEEIIAEITGKGRHFQAYA